MLTWFHCFAGASGDMLLGALADAGAPLAAMQQAIDAVGVERVRLSAATVTRHGIAATKVDVHVPDERRSRQWAEIRELLEHADLPHPVQAHALDAFARLAHAEASVHGVTPDEVHFHEVGALDAIADVVGFCAALNVLGNERVVCSPVALGAGMATGAHGAIPVPAPAALELLREAGTPVHAGPAPYELCTPTGAALLAATVTQWGDLPPMRPRAVGSGAGSRDLVEVPNLVRAVCGDPLESGEGLQAGPEAGGHLLLETNVDDLDPRFWPAVLDRLLDAGADDAWLVPILMKKGRPAHQLTALTPVVHAAAVRHVIFTETSTLGLRERTVGKHPLRRDTRTVHVDGHAVRVKLAYLDGEVVNAQPEYDDVAAAAATLGRPAKLVLAQATAAAQDLNP